MVGMFTLKKGSVILDPCFGNGVFIDSIHEMTNYVCHGYEIDARLYDTYAKKDQLSSLVNADFLLSPISDQYDGVIMNPPYIRHEKIDDLSTYGISKSALRDLPIFSELPKTANLYMYFILKALDLLKVNGEMIVIFPESWLNARSGKIFKNILEKKCSIENRIHISGIAFEKSALVDVVIFKIKKSSSIAECTPIFMRITGDLLSLEDTVSFHQIHASRVPFSRYAQIRRGLTTGGNSIFINPPISTEENSGVLANILSSPKAIKGFSTDAAKTDKLLVLHSKSELNKELSDFLKRREQEILKTNTPKTIAKRIRSGEVWYNIDSIDCNGILFGYIVRKEMRFILNMSGTLARDNFYIIRPSIDVNILMALLNNYYVFIQLETLGKRYGGGMLKLQKYDLQKLMLLDLCEISKEHKFELRRLGEALAKTGDSSIITEITKLQSEYENVSFDGIKQQYEYLRTIRLERGK